MGVAISKSLSPTLLPPSRLTAFVLKVLSLAQEQLGGSPEKLQETSKWLLSQQQADGSFQDPCPVIHRNMQVRACWGGPRGTCRRSLFASSPSCLTSSFLLSLGGFGRQ